MTHEELVKWDTLWVGTEVQDVATRSNCLGRDHSPVLSSVHGKKKPKRTKNSRVGGGKTVIQFLNILK